jgi:hypothetical protein
LLYGGVRFTPNVGLEYGIGERTTLNLSAGYNPWNLGNSNGSGKKQVHWLVEPEFRYWLNQRFKGHFFGVHALYAHYNIGGYKRPLLFGKGAEDYRHEGAAYGSGLSYGYQLSFTPRLALEFEIGGGYLHLAYDQYHAFKCGKFIGSDTRNYFGITNLGVTLVWNLF